MADAVDDDTVLVVGSAPQYPQGVIDPIGDLATIAAERPCSFHVDACMGGFTLPFMERLGLIDTPWDFRVPGVTSISADLHKYGYTPKGASVVLYRNRELRRHQTFTFDGWLGGFYGSSGVAGTKPGGPIAAAWASLHYLGEDGFLRLVAQAVETRRKLVAGVRAIPGLRILGEPGVTLAAIAADDSSGLDVFAIGTALAARGWHLDRQTPPDSLHATCGPTQAGAIVEAFLADLRTIVGSVDETGARATDRSTDYAVME
jgi:glutamate/tyrosine decarboxylase-like PLP-dependent enzyme